MAPTWLTARNGALLGLAAAAVHVLAGGAPPAKVLLAAAGNASNSSYVVTAVKAAAEAAPRASTLVLNLLACMIVRGAGLLLALATVVFGVQLLRSAQLRKAAKCALQDTGLFYASLWHYCARGGAYPAPHLAHNQQATVQIFSLVLVLRMWHLPHYRNGTFREDMAKNLRNVALPGTGLALSVFCHWKALGWVLLVVGYPLVAAFSAVVRNGWDGVGGMGSYRRQLLTPKDWFSFWRLNCRLATFHAQVTQEVGYSLEDKWKFIKTAEDNGIPISPCLSMPRIIVKHRNEEGGLGLHSFKNAASLPTGEWLFQTYLENDDFVRGLLPNNAPLSTFRVMSASRAGLPRSSCSVNPAEAEADVEVMSVVFRAGREGAITDHVSVLFDVDKHSGEIGRGTTNAHWYKLGLQGPLGTPWTSRHDIETHPDTGARITGTRVPDIQGMLSLVRRAHACMCPGVPIIGWDVALTTQGMLLLEANYSSNFFRGTFDKPKYFSLVHDYFTYLDARSRAAEAARE